MGKKRWWHGQSPEDLYQLRGKPERLQYAPDWLSREGWFSATDDFFPLGAELLHNYLTELVVPEVDELVERVREFARRERPTLPDQSIEMLFAPGATVFSEESEALWVDPARVFAGRDGVESYFRDQGDWSRSPRAEEIAVRDEPVLGLAEFAKRIAKERANSNGLAELLGPSTATGKPMIDLQGWNTPMGAVFRVNMNGNHRLAALAALGVPCVLAEVTWCHGPFDTSPGQTVEQEAVREPYRLLLHAFGVASYPDPLEMLQNFNGIFTQWPILIDTPDDACRSLRAMEALTGQREERVGRLPRQVFDDPVQLRELGELVRARLSMILVEYSAGNVPSNQRHGWWRRWNRR